MNVNLKSYLIYLIIELQLNFLLKSSIDNLLSNSLRRQIQKNLGLEKLEEIENRLIERHGMNLVQAIKDFYKLDSVLREFFGVQADEIETKILRNIVGFDKASKNKEFLTIQDPDLSKIFIETFGDEDKKAILGTVLDKSLIVADILKESNLPQTSGYRKINSLISDGFLISTGHEFSKDGKKIKKYETVFQNIKMEIKENEIHVKIQLKKELLSDSTIFSIVQI